MRCIHADVILHLRCAACSQDRSLQLLERKVLFGSHEELSPHIFPLEELSPHVFHFNHCHLMFSHLKNYHPIFFNLKNCHHMFFRRIITPCSPTWKIVTSCFSTWRIVTLVKSGVTILRVISLFYTSFGYIKISTFSSVTFSIIHDIARCSYLFQNGSKTQKKQSCRIEIFYK